MPLLVLLALCLCYVLGNFLFLKIIPRDRLTDTRMLTLVLYGLSYAAAKILLLKSKRVPFLLSKTTPECQVNTSHVENTKLR
jgi:hypothetical protein